ncbi:MAG: pseudouridine synthase, partial [Saccharofermentans sp.]|nr:pseudouridine synthase [Saccharofermentans sp.]
MRLNRFIANSGVCSRREADTFIQAGCVTVNGEVITELGTKVNIFND